MNTFSIPPWERFVQATPQLAIVEIDPAAEDPVVAAFSQVASTTRHIVFTVRSSGEELLWMPKETARASELLQAAIALARSREIEPAICPSAVGFPSDIPSTLSFLRANPVNLVVEPAALLAENMVVTAREHLARVQSALLAQSRFVGLVLSNTRWVDGSPVRTGLDNGTIPAAELRRVAEGLTVPIWVATVA